MWFQFEEFVCFASAGAFSALITVIASLMLEAGEAIVDFRSNIGLWLPHGGEVRDGHRTSVRLDNPEINTR